MSDTKHWFCLTHHAVETGPGCPVKDRLGPYPTVEEAGRALEKVAERNAEWDNDPAWNDGPGPGDGQGGPVDGTPD